MDIDSLRQASLITAIKTPYLSNGKFDLETYDRLVERQIKHGVQGLVVGGTTGEGHLMDWNEHIMLIAHTVHRFGKELVVIGNVGSNNTREAVHATEQGFAVGMHAGLIINPYYGKTSEEGVLSHLTKTLDIGPCIVYNVPGRTGQDIPPKVIQKLAKHPNFVGVKECAGNERIRLYEGQGIPCWSGNDDQSMEGRHSCGSHGVISVASNLLPDLMKRLMDEKDAALNESMSEIFDWLFVEPNPIPLNTIMAMAGLVKPCFRLPYVPRDEESRRKAIQILQKLETSSLDQPIKPLADEDFTLV